MHACTGGYTGRKPRRSNATPHEPWPHNMRPSRPGEGARLSSLHCKPSVTLRSALRSSRYLTASEAGSRALPHTHTQGSHARHTLTHGTHCTSEAARHRALAQPTSCTRPGQQPTTSLNDTRPDHWRTAYNWQSHTNWHTAYKRPRVLTSPAGRRLQRGARVSPANAGAPPPACPPPSRT